MDDAPGVRGGERAGDIGRDPERLRDGELALAVQPVAQGLAGHVRDGVVDRACAVAQIHFSGVEQGQDAGVLDPCGRSELPEEALAVERECRVRQHQPDGDGPVVGQVLREVDGPTSVPAELTLEAVAVGQAGLEAGEGVGVLELAEGLGHPSTIEPLARARTAGAIDGRLAVGRLSRAPWRTRLRWRKRGMGFDERLLQAVEGRYRLERELGHGGMATVYLAEDLFHNRPVALKVLRREITGLLGSGRFRREIEILLRLRHPSIVPVLDAHESPFLHYYVMPYVPGETLRDLLAREGPLPIREVLRIAGTIAEALDYAHSQNVLHRDIKPANILLEGNRVVVCDFGVARAVEAASADTFSSSGLVLGTFAYMSPEQAVGGEMDQRTDVYALGCVIYEMLAGEPAFSGPTSQAVRARVVSQEPQPLRVVRPDVPAEFETALRRALSKVPERRPVSAAELVAALRA